MRVSSVLQQVTGVQDAVLEGWRVEDDEDTVSAAPGGAEDGNDDGGDAVGGGDDDIDVDDDEGPPGRTFVISVRPTVRASLRCPSCGRKCPRFDRGGGVRRWRHLDFPAGRCVLEGPAPRITCPRHGVIVAAVPWARPKAKSTTAFEDEVAWFAKRMTKKDIGEYLGVGFRTIAAIIGRVVAEHLGTKDLLAGLTKIGIDEIAYRKGHRYLTVVVNHQTGDLVWAAEGRNKETLEKFFAALGTERAAKLTHVSADGAAWIHSVVFDKAPQTLLCVDPFHVIAWCTKALDRVRRRTVGAYTKGEKTRKPDQGLRWAVLKNPSNQTPEQRALIVELEEKNRELFHAYLIKEQLRQVFSGEPQHARAVLTGWISMVKDSGIPEFATVLKTITDLKEYILNAAEQKVNNGRVEATNTHLRALTRRAYGYHTPAALIADAMLARGGITIKLPGRRLRKRKRRNPRIKQ